LEVFSFFGIRNTHIFNNKKVRVFRRFKHFRNYVKNYDVKHLSIQGFIVDFFAHPYDSI
jgi:hypothetical protein